MGESILFKPESKMLQKSVCHHLKRTKCFVAYIICLHLYSLVKEEACLVVVVIFALCNR